MEDKINDLKWIVENGKDEIEYYLENVTPEQFLSDVQKLISSTQDKEAIQKAINYLQNLADVSTRFFFFTYAYWCENAEGKGNLSLTSKAGFPTQKDVKQKAIEQVKNRYDEPEYKISVVIESWTEMSKDDYTQWLS